MNRHYQSHRKAETTLPSWNLPFSATYIWGTNANGTYAFVPPALYEVGCDHDTLTLPLDYPTDAPEYGGKYTDGDVVIYFGVYADEGGYAETGSLSYTPSSSDLSQSFEFYNTTKDTNGKFVRDSSLTSMTYSDMNGCYALIPKIERRKYFYLAINASEESSLPDDIQAIIQNYPTVSGTFNKGSADSYIVSSNTGNLYLPNVQLYDMFSEKTVKTCPGDSPLIISHFGYNTSPATAGWIGGTSIADGDTNLSQYGGLHFTQGCGAFPIVTGASYATYSGITLLMNSCAYSYTDSDGYDQVAQTIVRPYNVLGGVFGDCGNLTDANVRQYYSGQYRYADTANAIPLFSGLPYATYGGTANQQHTITAISGNVSKRRYALFGFYRIITDIKLQGNYQFWG